MAYLEIETSEGGRSLPLGGDHLTIGRLSYNDLSIPSPQISRQHAELRCIDGAWWIVDLNSTNGLHLHGERIQEYKLSSGDRVVLAPNIAVRFMEEPGRPTYSTPHPAPTTAPPRAGEAVQRRSTAQGAPKLRRTAGDDSERRSTNPVGRSIPSSGQVYPPLFPPDPMLPEKPRSIFSDDEVPYVPGGMAPPSAPRDSLSPSTLDSPLSSNPAAYGSRGPATIPYSSWSEGAFSLRDSPPELGSGIPQPSNNWNAVGDLYAPVAPGSFPPSAAHHQAQDPYRRSEPVQNTPAGERESTTLLHVCQTCGQLTSPESVYCQHCHNSIAHECTSCRLSLLPIQDRCPRCHTPNDASVRRAHMGW